VSLLNPTCHKQRASSWERATGVGSQLGKLLAPEGRPGSRLLPGVADMDCGPEAEKRGFWPAWRRREGGGKPGPPHQNSQGFEPFSMIIPSADISCTIVVIS